MKSETKISQGEVQKFVKALQKLAGEPRQRSEEVTNRITAESRTAFNKKGGGIVELSVHSIDGDAGTLRVLQPTESVAFAKIADELEPDTVNFYLTRPVGAGVVETKLLGSVKHANSDGSWAVRFSTDRFAVSLDDPLLLHTEVVGRDGSLRAVMAMDVIT